MNRQQISRAIWSAFEDVYGWHPDDLDLKLGEEMARAACEALGVDCPEMAYPVDAELLLAQLLGDADPGEPSIEAEPTGSAEALGETCTEGGPVLVVPACLAARWGGVDTGDYDRACAPEDFEPLGYGAVGHIPVGSGRALVLEGELLTAFLPTPRGGVILRNYEELEMHDPDRPLTRATARACVETVRGWRPWGPPFMVAEGGLFLFDSAAPGAPTADAIEADEGVVSAALAAGTYVIDIATSDGVELIRLTRA